MSLRARLGGLGLVALIGAGPACAEGNRLLPFWGQPYPSGYASIRAQPAFGQEREPTRRHHGRHGSGCRCREAPHGRP